MSDSSASFRRHPLDARIPPPVLLVALAATMWTLARLWPGGAFVGTWVVPVALVSTTLALALEIAAVWRFVRARTTVDPRHPERSARLVTGGAHRYSRNPMYLGQTLLLLAWAVWLRHPLALVLTALFPLYITRFQILPEERALAARFGRDYEDYRKRVRRWV